MRKMSSAAVGTKNLLTLFKETAGSSPCLSAPPADSNLIVVDDAESVEADALCAPIGHDESFSRGCTG